MKRILLIFVLFLLAGCQSLTPQVKDHNGRLYSENTTRQIAILRHLRREGIGVLRLGDEVKVVLPADQFFHPGSTTMQSGQFKILMYVVNLINSYPNTGVNVVGYTDHACDKQCSLGVSRQQAHDIAQFLWRHGVKEGLVYASGMGDLDPIASNKTDWGRAQNRRIEITLKKAPSERVV